MIKSETIKQLYFKNRETFLVKTKEINLNSYNRSKVSVRRKSHGIFMFRPENPYEKNYNKEVNQSVMLLCEPLWKMLEKKHCEIGGEIISPLYNALLRWVWDDASGGII